MDFLQVLLLKMLLSCSGRILQRTANTFADIVTASADVEGVSFWEGLHS